MDVRPTRVKKLSQKAIESRTIKIYATTDQEMERHRIQLHNYVLPRLQKTAREHGWDIVLIDLRWGTHTEQRRSSIMLKEALTEVTNSDYYVSIIGAGYGWSPDMSQMNGWDQSIVKDHPWITQYKGCSVEEIEIRAAAFESNHRISRVFFHIHPRQVPPRPEAILKKKKKTREEKLKDKKLKELKDEIRAKYYVFNGDDDLYEMQQLTQKMIMSLKADLSSTMTNMPPRMRSNEILKYEFSRNFCGREQELRQIFEMIDSQREKEHSPIVITGESGSGKSSFMSKLAIELSKRSNSIIISHFINPAIQNDSLDSLIELVYSTLHPQLSISDAPESIEQRHLAHPDAFSYIPFIARLTQKQGTTIFLLIDGVDLIHEKPGCDSPSELTWLPVKLPPNLYVIVSRVDPWLQSEKTNPLWKGALAYAWNTINLEKPSAEDSEKIALNLLAPFSSSISKVIIEKLKTQGISADPVFRRILLTEVMRKSKPDTVLQYFQELVYHQDIEDLIAYLVSKWKSEYPHIPVVEIMKLLSVSRIGISEAHVKHYLEESNPVEQPKRIHVDLGKDEPIEIQASPQLRWEAFFVSMCQLLLLPIDGRYIYFHPIVAITVRRTLAKIVNEVQDISDLYVQYILSINGKQKRDSFTSSQVPAQYISEICHTYFISKQYSKLAEYMKEPLVITSMLGGKYKLEFHSYWKELSQNGFQPQKFYEDVVENVTEAGRLLLAFFKETGSSELHLSTVKKRLSSRIEQESLVDYFSQFAWALGTEKRLSTGSVYYHKCVDVLKRRSPDNSKLAMVYVEWGDVYVLNGKYTEASNSYKEGLDILVTSANKYHVEIASIYDKFGDLYAICNEWDNAFKCYREAFEARYKFLGTWNFDIAHSLLMMALMLKQLSRYSESIKNLQNSSVVKCKFLGEDHLSVASTYFEMGSVYELAKLNTQSIEAYSKCVRIRSRLLGPHHSDVVSVISKVDALMMSEKRPLVNWSIELGAKVLHKASSDTPAENFESSRAVHGISSSEVMTLFEEAAKLKKQKKFQEALEKYDSALNTPILDGKHQPNYKEAYLSVGDIHFHEGRYPEALEFYEKSLKLLLESGKEEDQIDLAICYESLGRTKEQLAQYQEAGEYFTLALKLRITLHGDIHELVANNYFCLGNVLKQMRKYTESIEHFTSALQIHIKLHGLVHHSLARIYFELGSLHQDLEIFKEAVAYYRKSLHIHIVHEGDDSDIVDEMYYLLIDLSIKLGRYDETVEYAQRSLKIREKHHEPHDSPVIEMMNILAEAQMNVGTYRDSLRTYEKLMVIITKAHGQGHDLIPVINANIARLYVFLLRNDIALTYLRKCLESKMTSGDDTLEVAELRYKIGCLLLDCGSFDEALNELKKALQIRIRVLGENHMDSIAVFHELAVVWKGLGRVDEYYDYFNIYLDRLGATTRDSRTTDMKKIVSRHTRTYEQIHST